MDDEHPPVEIVVAETQEALEAVRVLFQEYESLLSISLDFQDFAQELKSLPGEYADPSGTLLLAYVDGEPAGCCALRALNDVDYSNAAEMKRLFVRKAFRGFGLGRQLAEAVIEAATRLGYACVLLDTLDEMEAARALYEDLNFEEIPPYYHNSLPGAHYLKVDLD